MAEAEDDENWMSASLEEDIRAAINRHSAENLSNTPDFILAQFMLGAMETYGNAVQQRDAWYGVNPKPGWGWKDGDEDMGS